MHEQIAAHDLCGGLVADEPALVGQVLFGAAAAMALDARMAAPLLDRWQAGRLARCCEPMRPGRRVGMIADAEYVLPLRWAADDPADCRADRLPARRLCARAGR